MTGFSIKHFCSVEQVLKKSPGNYIKKHNSQYMYSFGFEAKCNGTWLEALLSMIYKII